MLQETVHNQVHPNSWQREALPYLQSLVIVLLKIVLANVTTLITQSNANGQNILAPAFNPAFITAENGTGNGQSKIKGRENGRTINGSGMPQSDNIADDADPKMTLEELNALRTREITGKAVSGILLLILKWFKLSRKRSLCFGLIRPLHLILTCNKPTRRPQVRVYDPATFGFKLPPLNIKALCTSGDGEGCWLKSG